MTSIGHPLVREENIPSDLAEARRIQNDIEEFLQAHRFAEKEIFAIRLALEEALVNAIKHGNQMDIAKKVRVQYQISTERFDVLIGDEGPGYNPEDVPDPTDPENLERPCGRGLFMIRAYMTEVEIVGRGNEIKMTKLRNGSANRSDDD